jgi:hypothetical protein
MDIRDVGWKGMDCIGLAQAADSCKYGDETLVPIKCGEFLE